MAFVANVVEGAVDVVGDVVGGVADAVGDVVGGAVDIVEDVVGGAVDIVEDVVGVVGDAVDWVVDEVVDPVLSGVGDIIDSALDDPISTIAKVAAVATGNAWALPLIDGAAVAANGGDLGDVVKAAAISYTTGKVAGVTSKFVNPAIANAGFNSTVETALQKGLEGGVKSATVAVVYGQDPLKAFATGGLNAAVGATLGQVADKIDAKFENFTGGIDVEGNPIIGGWEKLQDGVKDSITASLTAELTGGDVSSAQLAGIIGKYSGVSETMSKFLSENTGLDDETAGVMTSALTNAATAALSGNPSMSSEAFFAKWDEYGMEALKELVDKPVNAAIDKVAGTSKKAEDAANALNFAVGKAANAAEGFNGVRAELNGKIQEQDRLKNVYNQAVDAFNANPTQATQDAANIASAAYNNYAIALENDYNNTYKPQMDAFMSTYNQYNPQIEGLTDAYDAETQYLMSDIDDLNEAMKPVYSGANKAVALTLRPGIDEATYRELNGLEAGDDVYEHYLANQGIAEVFDLNALNEEAKNDSNADPYGEGYTSEVITVTKTDAVNGSTYDEEVLKYFVDTPDGKVEVDPYLEGIGGGRGGDPRDFNNGVWTMEDYRTEVAPPVTLGGRLTYDMASIVGDTSKQGQIITLNDFKKLKDAGYNITPFKDKFTGETINGNQSYDDILANYMQERARNPQYEKPTGYEPVDFMGYTEVSQDLHNDVVGYWKSTGLSDADARARAEQTAPVGSILNENSRFSDNSSLKDLVGFRDYIDNLEVGDEYKYSFNENYNDIMIAEAARLVGDADPSTLESFLRNTSGLGLDAIGQLAQTMSYATILTNAAGLTDTAAEETWLNSFGEVLSDVGTGIQTDEYRDKVENLNEDMANAMAESEGVGGTLKAILGVAWDNPTAFVSEYIVSEIFQELPLLLASGGTSVLLKGGATVAAKTVGKEFAETTLKRIGIAGAMTTAVGTNVAEGFGGAAQDGYEKGLATYNKVEFENLRAKGLSVGEARAALETPTHIEKAEQYASELAEQAGLIGGGLALITAGLGSKVGIPDNLALEKALFGDKKAPDGFIDQLKDYATSITAESAAEAGEEAGVGAFIEGRLALIDPTRDVSGNIAAAAFLGAIAGGGTTGGIRVGNDIVNVGKMGTEASVFIATSPPSVLSDLGIGSFVGPTVSGDSGAENLNGFTDPPPVQTLLPKLADLGLNADSQLDLANLVHNSQITTKQEVEEYVRLENPEFDFTGDNATNVYDRFVGNKSDSNLATEVASYIDPLYTTYAEAIAAARAEGVTLTDDQLNDIVGDGNVTEADVTKIIDDNTLSGDEVRTVFTDLGYTATDVEINDLTDTNLDTSAEDQINIIKDYVDSRQVTEDEIRKAFEDKGYNPTDEEIANLVGQGGVGFETSVISGLDTYIDSRQVTDAEARQFFADLGYEPTDAEVANFVAQVEENQQQTAINQYVDPRFVTQAEVQAIADAEGLTLTETLAATYLGQKDQESTLAAATAEFDPLATTTSEAKAFFEAQGFTPTDQQVADFVASKTEEDQKAAIAAFVDPRQVTTDEAKALFDALGYTATAAEVADFAGQGGADFASTTETNVGAYVNPRQVTDAEARQFFADLGYTPTDEEVADFTAQVAESEQRTTISDYVDPRFVTQAEVQAIADQEGLTLTEALAATYLGQKDQESTLAAATAEFDPLATTTAEAKQFFEDQGFTPTDQQVADFVASKTEKEQKAAIAAFVDPRQVTTDEAKALFDTLGYTSTDAEVADFVGQGGADFASTVETNVGAYVDPRQVTDAEARQFFADLGYTPTDEQVAQFVAQVEETTQSGLIANYIDPRQVTRAEVQAIADEEGLTLTDALAATYVGQGVAENYQTEKLSEARAEYDPLATTLEEATQFFADTGYTADTDEIAQFVASKTEEVQTSAIGAYVDPRQMTSDETREFLSAIGYNPTNQEVADFTGQLNDENYQVTQKAAISEYVDPRQVTVDEAKALFNELGYTYTDAEVANVIGQGDVDFADVTKTNVGSYVDPRQVTTDEAKSLFDALGYTATDEEIADFVGQGGVDFASTTETGVGAYVDPRQVTAEEVTAAYAELGLAKPTDIDIQALVGQYMEADLAGRAKENLSTAQYNSILSILDEFTAGTGVSDDVLDAINVVKADMVNALGDVGLEVAAIDKAVTDIKTVVDNLPEGVSSEDVSTAITNALADMNDLSADDVQGIVDSAVKDIDTLSADDVQGIVDNAVKDIDALSADDVQGIVDNIDTLSADDVQGIVDTTLQGLPAGLNEETVETIVSDALGSPAILGDNGNVVKNATGVYADIADLNNLSSYEVKTIVDTAVGALPEGLSSEDVSEAINTALEGLENLSLEDVRGVVETAVEDVTGDISDLSDILGTAGVADDPATDVDETQDPTGLFATIKAYENAGLDRDDALQKAIEDVAGALNTTTTDLLSAVGETETSLSEQITSAETNLLGEIGDVEANLGADIAAIADIIGKPARDVTQTDIDFVIDLIAQENISAELTTQYDVTGDGIVDINDQTLLETALQGEEDVTLANTSMFDPATGIYAALDTNMNANLDTDAVTDMITDMNTNINTKIDVQDQQQKLRDLASMEQQGLFKGAKTTVSSADPMNIDYLYDFNSVFANPSQEGLFASPYSTTTRNKAANQPMGPMPMASGFAKGGQVEDENDILLRLLGET